MGWTGRGSNPGEERFSAPVQTGPGAHPASYTMGTGSFPEVKRPERGVDHPYPPSTEVKERVDHTSTPPVTLRGLFYGVINLYLLLKVYNRMCFRRRVAQYLPEPKSDVVENATDLILH